MKNLGIVFESTVKVVAVLLGLLAAILAASVMISLTLEIWKDL